ncbi:O-antigen ligase family protein [Singulisphaera sp. PoT]|uniref:O-antigen ligase family protein n=1 Tax=Singulisphaera sp. PoT TaxID=3411797 RepID=UPI003BF5E711
MSELTITNRMVGLKWASEAILILIACLTPWAIGGVDAWSGFLLSICLVILAIIHTVTSWSQNWYKRVLCLPSLAIFCLGILGIVQSLPMTPERVKSLSPATYKTRADLTASVPQRTLLDTQPPVGLPRSTLSLDPDSTIHVVAQLAGSWILFQVALGLGSFASLRRLGVALMVNSTALTLFALVQSLSWNGKIYGIRQSPQKDGWYTGGPFVSHNSLAAALNLGLGFALAFFLLSSQRRRSSTHSRSRNYASRNNIQSIANNFVNNWSGDSFLIPAYAVGMILVGILGSHSRGGFLAMALSGLVTAALLRPKNLYFKGILAVLAIIPVLLVVLGTTSPFVRLLTIFDVTSSGYTGRFDLWKHVIAVWQTFPTWGVGLGSFASAVMPFLDFRVNGRGFVFFSHAEDEYLQLLVEGGIIGAVFGILAILGFASLIRRAYKNAVDSQERTLVMGGFFGCLALAFQSLSDFPFHIPGITVPALILLGYLCRLGLDRNSSEAETIHTPLTKPAIVCSFAVGIGMVVLGACVVMHQSKLARAEVLMVRSGLPFPGSRMPSAGMEDLSKEDLELRRAALTSVVRIRPNWWEGHYQLGMTYMGLFEVMATEWINDATVAASEEAKDSKDSKDASTPPSTKPAQTPADTSADKPAHSPMADPNWLHLVVHSTPADKLAEAGGVLEQEPIQHYLIPAAREFLEARRCSPMSATPHLRLATLDYLIEKGEPTSAHVARALELAGTNTPVLDTAAKLAAQAQDLDLAAKCWKQTLTIRGGAWDGWEDVVDAAGTYLPPDLILTDVLPTGALYALRFADRIYGAEEAAEVRTKFLKAGLERLPEETRLSKVEMLWLEAQLKARLDDRDFARRTMKSVLEEEPFRTDRRKEFAEWLMAWGDLEEAHRQALVGTNLAPNNKEIRETLQMVNEFLTRGIREPEEPTQNKDSQTLETSSQNNRRQ